MGNVIPQYQILTEFGVLPGAQQVGTDPIYASSSFFDGEILAYYSAGTSNILKQGVTNEAIIVGIALGGSANVLNTLLGSSSDGMMSTISNTNAEYWKSLDICPFEANLMNHTLAQADMGTQYGITRTGSLNFGGGITAVWSLDATKTGTSTRAVVIGFQQGDPYHGGIGDTNARVIAKFLACYSFWYNNAGGEF